MTRSTARAIAGSGVLLAGLVALRLSATGDLAAPPVTSLDALNAWIDDRGPAIAAFALVRLCAELVVWYLLGLTVLHQLGRTVRSARAATIADALTLPAARGLVHATVGIGLLTTTTGPAVAAAGSPSSSVSVMTEGGSHVEDAAGRDGVAAGTATMTPIEDPPASGTASMTPVLDVPEPPAAAEPVAPAPRSWTVAEGESFWTIAADVLQADRGAPPSDAEIDPYWRKLIEANRARFVDPDDADLILPGQVFEVPPTDVA